MDKQVIDQLSEYFPVFSKCINEGFRKAIEVVDKANVRFGKTTISNMINDAIIEKVRENFPPESFVKNRRRLKVLNLKGIFIKFKKLNNKHLVGNIPTTQAEGYAGQHFLPELKATIHLHLGWVLDLTGRKIERICLTCPESLASNAWVLNIRDYIDDNKIILVTPLMKSTELAASNQRLIQVTAKQNAKRSRERKKVKNE